MDVLRDDYGITPDDTPTHWRYGPDALESKDFSIEHPLSPGKRLFFMTDPTHVLKSKPRKPHKGQYFNSMRKPSSVLRGWLMLHHAGLRPTGLRNALFNSRHGSKKTKRAMFWPIVVNDEVILKPCDWCHVEDAFNAMSWRQGTAAHPSGMTASSVHLTAESKMKVQPVSVGVTSMRSLTSLGSRFTFHVLALVTTTFQW